MFDQLASMAGTNSMTANPSNKKSVDRETAERQGLGEDQSSVAPGQSTTIQSEAVALQSTTRVQPTQETAAQQLRTDQQKASSEPLSSEEKASVTKAVAKLNETIGGFNIAVQFNVHEEYDELVIQVMDKESEEMIRQIPPEEALAIASFFSDLQAARKAEEGTPHEQATATQRKLAGIMLHDKV